MQTTGVEEREIRSRGYIADLFCAFVYYLCTVHLSLFYIIRLLSLSALPVPVCTGMCVISPTSHTLLKLNTTLLALTSS